jgi:DNA-binding GntR family transcriptional regulator
MATEAPVRAADRAHAFIREEILRGRLAPNTMLSENDLASRLAMSRTPVRTALSRLQDEGWVTIYPQRGALVRQLSDQEVQEASDVRNALETAGVQRSAPARRESVAQDLEANLVEQERSLAGGDFDAFTRGAMAFHRGFVEMADNRVMLSLYDKLQDWQYLSIVRSSAQIVGDPESVLDEHRALLDDAVQGEWVRFSTRLQRHQDRSHGLETGRSGAR